MAEFTKQVLRELPQIDELLRREEVRKAGGGLPGEALAVAVREAVSDLRRGVLSGMLSMGQLRERIARLPDELRARIATLSRSSLRPVINGTGILIHTNLGRAPLARGALERVVAASGQYASLEYDIAAGRRGSRGDHLAHSAARLFPGCLLHAVNNNAAALLLVLNTFAQGREVLISRGELIEIGGSFRIPDILARSGAILREVGTTNRTRLADYEKALGPSTAMILKVHTSNYRIVGFTASAALEDLVGLGRQKGVPVVVDQGSGSLVDVAALGMPEEPPAGALLAAGADLVLFSGDKMLGGPQAGLIVGAPEMVKQCAQNPLSRALRLDKMAIAALEWVLQSYASGRAVEEIPLLRMLFEPAESVGRRALRIARSVRKEAGSLLRIEVVDGASLTGGGSAPLTEIPTRLLSVSSQTLSAAELDERLRSGEPPVVGRLHEGRLLIDPRTVLPEQQNGLIAALRSLAAREPGNQYE